MIPLLEARQVTKVFGGGLVQSHETVALEDFSFTIDTDQPLITGVVGESGSGKTTMARLLLGFESPTEGEVLYEGKDLRQLSRQGWRAFRRDVQAIFQDPFEVFNSFYKVDHVLKVPIAKFGLAESRQGRQALMEEALQTVGLRPEETLGRYPHQLSGGQRQRIMVARALLLKPQLIIADEPVSMIDASLRATVLTNLRQLRDEFGISLIYITHDLTTAYQICDNIIVLYEGSVAEAGDVQRVVKEPRHPYTSLLIGSIPLPDPDRHWSDRPEASLLDESIRGSAGCKFTPRCPHAFAPCVEQAPPLFQTDRNRAAACYLYQDAPALPFEKMDLVLDRKPQPAGEISG